MRAPRRPGRRDAELSKVWRRAVAHQRDDMLFEASPHRTDR